MKQRGAHTGLVGVLAWCPVRRPTAPTGSGVHWPSPSRSRPRYLPKSNEEKCPHRDMYKNVHSSLIQLPESGSSSQLVDGWRKWPCLHHGILSSHKKGQSTEEFKVYYTEWKEPDTKAYILYGPFTWKPRRLKLIYRDKDRSTGYLQLGWACRGAGSLSPLIRVTGFKWTHSLYVNYASLTLTE